MREQFLAERVEYFKELQRLLYVEALNEESASKQMLVRALCKSDLDMGEKQVDAYDLRLVSASLWSSSINLIAKTISVYRMNCQDPGP